nr:uncharacterized protein LOC128694321 [Cherax quadricarinatus]
MKEFYLVPTSVMNRKPLEIVKLGGDENLEGGGGCLKRGVKRKIKLSPVREVNPPALTSVKPQKTPDLSRFMHIRVSARNIEYVKSMLVLLQRNPLVSWDENGDLLTPITGRNIIEILNVLSENNVKSARRNDSDYLTEIKHLLNITGIHFDFVRNTKVRRQLLHKGGGVRRETSWISY